MFSVFHESKRIKGVDALLLRLFGPIIWRSLRCANSTVRVHATSLFLEAFPLQNPDAGAADLELLVQKQVSLMFSQLEDDHHLVRCAAVSGICRALASYWELVPSLDRHRLLGCMVCTLAHDKASAQVRRCVFLGFAELLSNPLSHSALKQLVAHLRDCLHDSAEKV